MPEGLVALLIQNLPELVGSIKDLFHRNNPDAPPLTDAQVHDAFILAVSSTIAKDDLYLAAQPTSDQ